MPNTQHFIGAMYVPDVAPTLNGKTALITGVTGQDGSYLAELLLSKGYIVHGIKRRQSTINTERIDHIRSNPVFQERFFLDYGDMTDSCSLLKIINNVKPDEVYNLAAQSHVKISFEVPEFTAECTGVGTIRMLDAIYQSGLKTKFYQASTSELYGGLPCTAPQSEATPFYPKSPYGAAKLYSYWVTVNYREAYGLFACNGILFNHESPRRGRNFVTRKITHEVAQIALGKSDRLTLGNLNAKRDWGFAGDYVEGMWRMLQQDKPGDWVLASGETHTVREFVELAFAEVGITIRWEGEGVDEKGLDSKTGKVLVDVDKRFFRPAEVELLWGNPQKAERELGWKAKVSLKELVAMMVKADIEDVKKN